MQKEIDFYFEFSSPYGYLAAMKIEELAERQNAKINWHPFILGAVLKQVGTKPLTAYPMKGEYSAHDMARTARLHDIPFAIPEPFPVLTVNACRLVLWAAGDDQLKRAELSKAIYRAGYEDKRSMSDKAVLLDIAEKLGYDRSEAEAGMAAPEIKDQLKAEMDQVVEKKVFGSPFFIVDGEAFWGFDRMDQLEKWLETGGW